MWDPHRTWELFLFQLSVLTPFGRKLDCTLTLSVSFSPQNFRAGGWGSSCVRIQETILRIPSPSGLSSDFQEPTNFQPSLRKCWAMPDHKRPLKYPCPSRFLKKEAPFTKTIFQEGSLQKTRHPILKCPTPTPQPEGHPRSCAFQDLLRSNKKTRDTA